MSWEAWLIASWQKTLTPQEVEHLRRAAQEMAGRFYSEEDW